MHVSKTSDLAQANFLISHNNSLKNNIQHRTSELVTGQVSDIRSILAGNYDFLTDVERQTTVLKGFATASTEALFVTEAMQKSIEHFGEISSNLAADLLNVGSNPSAAATTNFAVEARAAFGSMVSTLNLDVAGRYVFSGNRTDQQPLLSPDSIITELRTAIAGSTTPEDMIDRATTWFDDPGGFASFSYVGGENSVSPFFVSSEESVAIDLRANDPGFIGSLRNAAIAALANDPAFALSSSGQAKLFELSGQDLLSDQHSITGLESRVGFAEAKIGRIATRNATELTGFSIAKNSLLEVDPFEAATRLEEAQFQLQSLYSITVRLTQLSLVNFL